MVVGFIFWNRKLSKLNHRIAEAHQELAQKSKELERLSITDALTEIYNRMRLEQILESEIKRVQRYQRSLAVIMLDIDRFKNINDTAGHQAGDHVLRLVAQLLCNYVRQSDTVGRWGGEEFLIICPETDCKGATDMSENLRQYIEDLELEATGKITCSFGVAEWMDNEKAEELVNRADNAMYKAKELGRNQVFSEQVADSCC